MKTDTIYKGIGIVALVFSLIVTYDYYTSVDAQDYNGLGLRTTPVMNADGTQNWCYTEGCSICSRGGRCAYGAGANWDGFQSTANWGPGGEVTGAMGATWDAPERNGDRTMNADGTPIQYYTTADVEAGTAPCSNGQFNANDATLAQTMACSNGSCSVASGKPAQARSRPRGVFRGRLFGGRVFGRLFRR